jgi:hypothetical protein
MLGVERHVQPVGASRHVLMVHGTARLV